MGSFSGILGTEGGGFISHHQHGVSAFAENGLGGVTVGTPQWQWALTSAGGGGSGAMYFRTGHSTLPVMDVLRSTTRPRAQKSTLINHSQPRAGACQVRPLRCANAKPPGALRGDLAGPWLSAHKIKPGS